MDALLIRKEWLDLILTGRKTWEIRGNATKKRGQIALIESGSGTVVGTCKLVDVCGPLDVRELRANASKAGFEPLDIQEPPYRSTYAWVLRSARRLPQPVPYAHPAGAVIWVKLSRQVSRHLGTAAS